MGLNDIMSILLYASTLLVILLKSDEVEEIMLQVSNLSTSTKSDGDGRVKLPIREGYLNLLQHFDVTVGVHVPTECFSYPVNYWQIRLADQ